ncbi:MAG TPA: FAD-dependent oxidoreductase [Bradyrhizobium sp.]|uniref:FAD-dependent oxidoreductase n=1 Tax=Bradyrhizobium sp. TaxID=376 RepID=UPI002D809A3B|nr:FAD-dependent oxidoreductase [Bradyrhizobium sp.]HET7884812.1 FAD-dependent oxidoreductase [Bradyrhizobium sp.]
MTAIKPAGEAPFDVETPVLIIGAGAAGLCAALTAKEAGIDPLVVERDERPSGSTSLSAGLIPAAATRFQRAKGIADDPQTFVEDIQRKAANEADPMIVQTVAQGAAPLVEWLSDRYGLPFDVIDNFNYPGHSAMRMHGLPARTGVELIDHLRRAAEDSGISIVTGRTATSLLIAEDHTVCGVETLRGDGVRERIRCEALVLACNGYGGNPDLVRRHVPEMASALYFGHPGNRGDAIVWGEALGAQLEHLGAYQGHGSVAIPHNILITWAAIMQGGFQVNRDGRRFSNESLGYSEQAAEVLKQPGGVAWCVFDARIASVARQFEDFRQAERAGAILTQDRVEALAEAMHVPLAGFGLEWAGVETLKAASAQDRYGRQFSPEQRLVAPFHAVKVTGALFHTQGGLAIDTQCRVRRRHGGAFPNLFAAGGAAAGVSGSTAAGYLSGNGLLTATVLGRLAGAAAARRCVGVQ